MNANEDRSGAARTKLQQKLKNGDYAQYLNKTLFFKQGPKIDLTKPGKKYIEIARNTFEILDPTDEKLDFMKKAQFSGVMRRR